LFRKAYSDYSDIDGDGQIDTTYKDSIEYLGYFDSNFCYQYDNGKFSPIGQVNSGTHKCSTVDGWSGNFLNWASMTRIDLIRTVLHGGKRQVDPASSSGNVLLERELIPPDIHAFAKVYDGAASGAIALADLVQGSPANGAITLCNVSKWPASTAQSGTLDTSSYPPLLRVAYGNATGRVGYPNWGATEVVQCQWNGTANSAGDADRPAGNDTSNAYKVLVERCVASQDGPVSARCKRYDNNTPSNSSDDLFKPIGLLQRYGERGQMRFGLMTGSYDNNSHGGVLRQGVGLLSEVSTTTGKITADKLIGTLDKLRIATYRRASASALGSGGGYQNCGDYVPASYVKNGSCADWGNPLGEIYLEAVRYLAGASAASSAYLVTEGPTATENDMVPGLTRLTSWSDPYNFGPSSSAVPCAQCALLLISTSQGSFDSMRDAADWPSSGLPTGFAVATATNAIQTKEGLDGVSVLAGRVGSSTDQECSPKTMAAGTLDQVDGICPEAPSAEGGYDIAGLAYEAAVKDLRTGLSGTQKIKTFAVSVAEDLPSFIVTSSTNAAKQAQIVPLCKSRYSHNVAVSHDFQKCSLVDVIKESNPSTLPSPCTSNGSYHRFLLTWEGTAWGSDHDFDMEQRLEYCEAAGNLWVRTSVTRDQAGAEFNFGFTLVGTDPTQTVNYPAEVTISESNSVVTQPARSLLITGGGTRLQKPLWLAAKYGGFTDLDGDGTPVYKGSSSDRREWDSVDNLTGVPTPDGVPDNYYQLRNPTSLEAALTRIFASVAGSVASGTAAAVVANSSTGVGAVYQALYHPLIENGGQKITWGGTLQALFIDGKGRLREDSNGDATLDGCDVDPVVEIFFDAVNLPTGTKIRRYTGGTANCSNIGAPVVLALENLHLLWSANPLLANLSDVTTQRNYATATDAPSGGGRHLLTAIDGTLTNFDTASINSSNFTWFNVASEAEADNIVRWVRGEEGITGQRSRTIEFDASHSGLEPWRLGDIINSTPTVVGRPNANYDLLYGDASYLTFKTQYAGRRQVVYVGANDGMVHAFNGGFWDEANLAFTTSSASKTAHPLGAELWGYVPENLLPHLKWLTDPAYPHVYYMDGSPKSYDVRIFSDDATHPGGWGTILVVGMRLGGGAITVDTANNGLGAPNNSDDRTLRSAYVVLDVTDPEQPPALIAEISHANLGLTTSQPTLVKRVTLGVTPSYQWELVFGSGPTVLTDVTSTQNARLYRYDLVSQAFVSGFAPLDLGVGNSFVGDPSSVDWDLDYLDDAVYFGIASGTGSSMSGRVSRLRLSDNQIYPLLNGAQPVVAAPMTSIDGNGSRWIHVGSGKLFSTTDRSNAQSQALYGIKEPYDSSTSTWTWGTVSASDLLDSNSVRVFT
ncbi:MAG TPA: PilC/PilY family type IV pilus protein, partial [Pseudomonadales bacterium]|nr:PilC/PilY family type IV pilus protein [Pseudomonadales bacterium]